MILFAVKLFGFGGEDEIVIMQAVDFVREHFNFNLTPRKTDIRMMAEIFCQLANLINKSKGGYEIFKLE